jgi:hypothetical protein
MNIEESISFLSKHQPMPSDDVINNVEAEIYFEIVKLFEKEKDIRCIPLLINSVSENTGMGMYEYISDSLQNQDREKVIESIRIGLRSKKSGVVYRCCWWGVDLDAWELINDIEPLLFNKNADIKEAAGAFVDLRKDYA